MATKAKKAPAKKANAGAVNKAWSHAALPEGYAPINNGEFGERWEFEKMPVLEGVVVGDAREVETGTGKNKRTSQVVTVRSADGKSYDVWSSASLRGFFERVEDGSEVALVFKGYRDVGRPQPMKVFEAGIVGDDDEEEAPRSRSRSKTKARR